MKKTKKLVSILLLVVLVGTLCITLVACDNPFSKIINLFKKDKETPTPKIYTLGDSTLTLQYNVKANRDISIDIKTPDTYRAYRIKVTGKDAKGNTIPIGNKENYKFSIYKQVGSHKYQINEAIQTLICTTRKSHTMSYDFDTNKNEKWTIYIDPSVIGTYTVKIIPFSHNTLENCSPAKATTGYDKKGLVTSRLWVNYLPDMASEKNGGRPQVIAYVNRNDISTFIEAIHDKNSSSTVASALVNSFGFAANFIPYVGTGLSVAGYVKDIIDGFDAELYDVKTQKRVIDAFEKAFGTRNYRKVDFKHGMLVTFVYNGWGYNVSIIKWRDNETCDLWGATGCSGYFVPMRKAWNA